MCHFEKFAVIIKSDSFRYFVIFNALELRKISFHKYLFFDGIHFYYLFHYILLLLLYLLILLLLLLLFYNY